jgi:hypothetical protein
MAHLQPRLFSPEQSLGRAAKRVKRSAPGKQKPRDLSIAGFR